MKDLITTMAAIMILMVFVMQFANNQIILSKITAADNVSENFQKNSDTFSVEDKETLKRKISESLCCRVTDVKLNESEEKISLEAPIGKAIVCGDFLGISEEDNRAVYRNCLWKN